MRRPEARAVPLLPCPYSLLIPRLSSFPSLLFHFSSSASPPGLLLLGSPILLLLLILFLPRGAPGNCDPSGPSKDVRYDQHWVVRAPIARATHPPNGAACNYLQLHGGHREEPD